MLIFTITVHKSKSLPRQLTASLLVMNRSQMLVLMTVNVRRIVCEETRAWWLPRSLYSSSSPCCWPSSPPVPCFCCPGCCGRSSLSPSPSPNSYSTSRTRTNTDTPSSSWSGSTSTTCSRFCVSSSSSLCTVNGLPDDCNKLTSSHYLGVFMSQRLAKIS